MTHAEFAKAVIRSRRRMTYAEALQVLQGGSCGEAEVDAVLREAGSLARVLRERRMKQAESVGLNPEFMKEVMQAIHEESVKLQLSLFEDNNQ